MQYIYLKILIIIFFSIFIPTYAYSEEIRFDAKSLQKKGSVYTLQGSVYIEGRDSSIYADTVLYDESTGDAYAEGGVKFEDSKTLVNAGKAQINLNTGFGSLYDADMSFKATGFFIKGNQLTKTDKYRYVMKDATATTCEGVPPSWCFKAKDVEILKGEWMRGRGAYFYIKNTPMLYSPYFWAPVIEKRRSGLLIPEIGYRGSTGLYLLQSYYWAIAENRDATFTLHAYGNGGIGQGIEYRYIETAGIKGEFTLTRIAQPSGTEYYRIMGMHTHEIDYMRGFADMNLVSRGDYYRLFEPHTMLSSTRYLQSRAEASVPLSNSRAYVLGTFYQDLKDNADSGPIVQRLPETGFFHSPVRLGKTIFTGGLSYVRFSSEDKLEAHRNYAYARLSYGIGSRINLTQSVMGRETLYSVRYPGSSEFEPYTNGTFNYKATLKTGISRQYETLNHEVLPSLSFNYSERELKSLPLLDALDYENRQSLGEAVVLNRVTPDVGSRMIVRLIQQYDFNTGHRPLLPLGLDLAFRKWAYVNAGARYNHYDAKLDSSYVRMRFSLPRTAVTLENTTSYTGNLEYYNAVLSLQTTEHLTFDYDLKYDAYEDEFSEQGIDAQYMRQCWGFTLSFIKRPSDYSVYFRLNMLGLGQFGKKKPEYEELI